MAGIYESARTAIRDAGGSDVASRQTVVATTSLPPTPPAGLTRPSRGPDARIVWALRVALLTAGLVGLARTYADPDLWGHVRFGLDILAGGIPAVDPYSFTSDIPWINHEWLAEVIMAATWTASGSLGLVVLKLLTAATVLGLVGNTLARDRVPTPAFDLILAATLVALWPRLFVIRPQIFSLLLFALLLWILREADRGRRVPLLAMPMVFALWVNLHGGWLVGMAVLVVRTAATSGRGKDRTRAWAAVGLSVAATLVNPYGYAMWTFLGRTVRLSRPEIRDWQPLLDLGAGEILPFLAMVAVAGAALARPRRGPRVDTAIVIGLGVATLAVNRLDAFFAVAVAMLSSAGFSPPAGRSNEPPAAARWPVTAGTACLAAGLIVGVLVPGGSCIRLDGPWMPERGAGAFLAANRFDGRLLVWFGWGEYAIWHLFPGLQVSIDGRRETVYSPDFLRRHVRLYFGPEAADDILRTLEPDVAWLPAGLPLARRLEAGGWQPIYAGPISVVLSREPRTVAPAPPGLAPPGCFPGP